ncbi:putative ABC transporter permease [Collinsella tanakaei]|uniref:putative ABC transporter permease n=1 Tax=Collinsella tanakaei TaxID=626935 RepID=UPI001F3C7089|nr:putative ABC transporter permease [Collinsella tanakaei]
MSTISDTTARKDPGLPGNDLDPKTQTPEERRRIPRLIKVYGILCLISGIVTLPLTVALIVAVALVVAHDPAQLSVARDPTLTIVVTALNVLLSLVGSILLIRFGRSLLKNRRRNAAIWSEVLIAITFAQGVISIMLDGIGLQLIQPAIQLVILLAISVTIDPSLRQERDLQRRLQVMQEREAAEEGMLGRDITGEGYIKLNFFNLFWVFMVCSVIGLMLEIIWHMTVVDPGVYQDRAGLLFGPFSPIYGVGAVLMTVALNRFYRKHFAIIFLVSAAIGGAFEFAVSWFMQTAFGAVAWDYTGSMIFGVIPDPIAALCDGRTSTMFASIWGILGLVWIKLLLPRLLKLINLIPWKARYSVTSLCAVLMLVNAVMTLQALDCWFERVSDIAPSSPVEEFYADHFDNSYMEHRFQSMTIHPDNSGRMDSGSVAPNA